MRILIAKDGSIADVLAALTAVKELVRRVPGLEITFLSSAERCPLAAALCFVSKAISTLPEDLSKYAAAVDLNSSSRLAEAFLAAGITRRLGFGGHIFSRKYSSSVKSYGLDLPISQAENFWQVLRRLKPELNNTVPRARLVPGDFRQGSSEAAVAPCLVAAPFQESGKISLTVQNWVLSLNEALRMLPNPVVVLSESDLLLEAALEPLRAEYPERLQVRGPLSDEQALGLFAQAQYFAGGMNGYCHLAAAFGCAGFALVNAASAVSFYRAPFGAQLSLAAETEELCCSDFLELVQGLRRVDYFSSRRAQISAFIVCCDEEKSIERCLESVRWCDEILIVDSGSTDRTLEISRRYTDRIAQRPWPGFVEQKRFGLEQCRNEWVLNLDADEEVSIELRSAILSMLGQSESKRKRFTGYKVSRVVYFLERWWERGGWYPEYRLRVLRRDAASWGGTEPHERALTSGRVGLLKGPLYHYTYGGIPNQIESLNSHSTSSAKMLFAAGERTSVVGIIAHAVGRFIKFYFLKRGFLEGRAGFLVGIIESVYAFLKYAKLWELQRISSQRQLRSSAEGR